MAKLFYEKVFESFKLKNITLLDDNYTNSTTKMNVKCNKCNYMWKTSYISMYNSKHGCPNCTNNIIHSNEFVQEHLKKHNIITNDIFLNSSKKMQFICAICNYQWATTFKQIYIRKNGCPKCANVVKHTNEFVEQYLLEHNIIMKDKYKNLYTYMSLQCIVCGYNWNSKFNTIFNFKCGCPKCAGNVKHLPEYVEKYLLEHNLKLNTKYKNVNDKISYTCLICNYTGQTNFDSIHNKGHNCLNCAGLVKYTNEYVHSYLKKHNIFSNDIYKNCQNKMTFKCLKCNNNWITNFNSIYNVKTRCPICASAKSEQIVRHTIEMLLNKTFPKYKNDWLINPKTGRKLELDMYNEELKLCIEHDGLQHFIPVKNFGGEKAFQKNLERDLIKNKLCTEHGVKMIRVPALFFKLPLKNLKPFLKEQLIKNDIQIPENWDNIDTTY